MSKGGIIIPDTLTDKPVTGTIVAVGEGKMLDNGTILPCKLSIGDVVMFAKFSGMEVMDSREDGSYLIMDENNVIGRVIEDPHPQEG